MKTKPSRFSKGQLRDQARDAAAGMIGRARKLPVRAGASILLHSELRAAEKTLMKIGIPLPDGPGARKSFFDYCAAVAWRPASASIGPRFCQFPDAFCFTVWKLREALRETNWVMEPRKLQKARPAISTEQIDAAFPYSSPGDESTQSKTAENAAAAIRSRAAADEKAAAEFSDATTPEAQEVADRARHAAAMTVLDANLAEFEAITANGNASMAMRRSPKKRRNR
jgi:hypothetical protein